MNGQNCSDKRDISSEAASSQFFIMQGPMTCWNLGSEHPHATAESVSASEQPEYAEALL